MNRKNFKDLPLEERINYLLWVKNTEKDIQEVYECSLLLLGDTVGHMFDRGFIKKFEGVLKCPGCYITDEGIEHIKNYNPFKK